MGHVMRGPLIAAALCAAVLTPPAAGASAPTPLRLAPDGSDAGRCTSSAPCRSLGRAYLLAVPGQRVSIAAGSYGEQVIPYDARKNAARSNVEFVAAPGVRINGDLTVDGSHVTIRGAPQGGLALHTLYSRVTSANATSHQMFQNLRGATFQIWGTTFVTIRDSDWGPGTEPMDSESRITPDGGVLNSYPAHIVLDHIVLHDQNSVDLLQHHNGGLMLVAGHDIVIRNSAFLRNVVYDIEVQDFTNSSCCSMKYGNAFNVTLEGNTFRAPVLGPPYGTAQQLAGQPEVQFDPQGGGWSNWTIRRNIFEEGLGTSFDGDGSFYRNFTVERNIAGRLTDCGGANSGAVWRDNIIAGGRCGSRSAGVPFGYQLKDMRLVPSEAAATIRSVFGAAAAGASPARAAMIARSDGSRRPPAGWTAAAVRSILTNRLYLGGRYGPAGAHPGLVSARVWKAAQHALSR